MDALARHRMLQLVGVPVGPARIPSWVETRAESDFEDDDEFDDELGEDLEDLEDEDLDEPDDDEDADLEESEVDDANDEDEFEDEDEPEDDDPVADSAAQARHRTLELLGIELRALPRDGDGDGFYSPRKGMPDKTPIPFGLAKAAKKAAPRKVARKPSDITGAERKTLGDDIQKRHAHGESVEDIAASLAYNGDLSEAGARTLVRDLLRERGVDVRPRPRALTAAQREQLDSLSGPERAHYQRERLGGATHAAAMKAARPAPAKVAKKAAAFDPADVAGQVASQKTEADIVRLLSADPNLTAVKLRRIAEHLGTDVPDGTRAKSSLILLIAENEARERDLPGGFSTPATPAKKAAPARKAVAGGSAPNRVITESGRKVGMYPKKWVKDRYIVGTEDADGNHHTLADVVTRVEAQHIMATIHAAQDKDAAVARMIDEHRARVKWDNDRHAQLRSLFRKHGIKEPDAVESDPSATLRKMETALRRHGIDVPEPATPNPARVSRPAKAASARPTPDERTKLADRLHKRYEAGESLQDIATAEGKSAEWVRRLLTSEGKPLRPRGAAPAKKATPAKAVAKLEATKATLAPYENDGFRQAYEETVAEMVNAGDRESLEQLRRIFEGYERGRTGHAKFLQQLREMDHPAVAHVYAALTGAEPPARQADSLKATELQAISYLSNMGLISPTGNGWVHAREMPASMRDRLNALSDRGFIERQGTGSSALYRINPRSIGTQEVPATESGALVGDVVPAGMPIRPRGAEPVRDPYEGGSDVVVYGLPTDAAAKKATPPTASPSSWSAALKRYPLRLGKTTDFDARHDEGTKAGMSMREATDYAGSSAPNVKAWQEAKAGSGKAAFDPESVAMSLQRDVDRWTTASAEAASGLHTQGETGIRQALAGLNVGQLRRVAAQFHFDGKPPPGLTPEQFIDWLLAQWKRDRGRWSLRSGLAPDGEIRLAGQDVTPGHDELHHYWTRGEGLAKWRGSPHPWTTLYHHLLKYVNPEQAKRMASKWFIEVFGYAAGSDLHRVESGKPPRGHRIGPG